MLIGAILFAAIVSAGLGSALSTFQLLLFAVSAPFVAWFEVETPRVRFGAIVVRTFISFFGLISVLVVMSVAILEALQPFMQKVWFDRLSFTMVGASTAFSLGFSCSPAVIGSNQPTTWKRLLSLIGAGLFSYVFDRYKSFDLTEILVVPLVVIVLYVTYRVGQQAAVALKPSALAILPVYDAVKHMTAILTMFVFGYLLLILVFSATYAGIARLDSAAFAGSGLVSTDSHGNVVHDRRFSVFLHLSVATATTLGYGDVYPASPLSRLATSLQVILSLGWTIVVFAAAIEAAKEFRYPDTPE